MKSEDVIVRLEASRKELLDLGLRSPLINYRKRARQVRVVDELSIDVFRILIREGRSMYFDALFDNPDTDDAEESERSRFDLIMFNAPLAQPDEPEGELPVKWHADTRLQTTLASEKLQSRLLSLHNDARTYLEERGVNVLYLAIGYLHWYENSSATKSRRAPLLLVPSCSPEPMSRSGFAWPTVVRRSVTIFH